MKKSLPPAAYPLILSSITVYSQPNIELDGQFSDSRDTFIFYFDSVSFDIMSNGGLIHPMEGMGTFSVESDILTIKTNRHSNEESPTEELRELGEREFVEGRTLVFRINDFSTNLLNLTLIGIINSSEFHKKRTIKKFRKGYKEFKFRGRQLKKKI